MALEVLTGTDKFIDDLVSTNPTATDDVSEGDNHIRGVKNVLKNTFPNVTGAVSATHTNLDAAVTHSGNTSNPHSVNKSDVGLANVDNTTDAAKPVSTAQASAIALKANLASPTFTGTVAGITKVMVGLANVDNTSDANKPVSTAQATADGLALPKAGGAMTGAITTNSTFDGVDIATRDGVLTSTTTTAGAALPKAGGAMTGAITTNSTFDGVDIAARDGVLTSTTTTAAAALPKAGGTMTGTTTLLGITETEAGTANATYTIDLANGTLFEVTHASLCTVTMPTAAAGKAFTVIATVPAAWSGTILWSGGSAPTGGSGKTIYSFVSNGTSWYGMRAGTGFA